MCSPLGRYCCFPPLSVCLPACLSIPMPTQLSLCFSAPGIDLENIVYYKDDTHYFVMTAKKKSLLKKGVIKEVRTAHTRTHRQNVRFFLARAITLQ